MNPQPEPARTAADSFARFCECVTQRLPPRFRELIAPSAVGFVVINGFTFSLDLALVALLHGRLGCPVWLAITVSYLSAFAVSFALNRWLNFRSHAPAGRQVVLYLVAIAVNYVAILLGIGAGLTACGVHYELARLIAGLCEGVFMYSALRWVVFAPRTA